MPEEFCTHLTTYGLLYEGAAIAYEDCLELMDQLLADPHDQSRINQLEHTLNTWEMQTRELREKFVKLTEKGEILLPNEGQNDQPVCAHCGEEVKRLAFPEFTFEEDGSVTFRGKIIQEPVAETV